MGNLPCDELNAADQALAEKNARAALAAPLSVWIWQDVGGYVLVSHPLLPNVWGAPWYDAIPGITARRSEAMDEIARLNKDSRKMALRGLL